MIKGPDCESNQALFFRLSRKLFSLHLRYSIMRQSFLVLFSMVVLFSTTGVPHAKHLCGGIVQSAGIWMSSLSCDHDIASVPSCSSHASAKAKKHSSSVSCCKELSANQSKKKDCCTNQIEWKLSQLDLAVSDPLLLEGHVPFVFSVAHVVEDLHNSDEAINPYVRPPPLRITPQSRRRALLQVYHC